MKARLRFYGPLAVVNFLCLAFLLFFFHFNWDINKFQTIREALHAMISSNPRWITWGVCAGGSGLILGFLSVIWLFIPVPSEDEENLREFILDLTGRGFFLSICGTALFFICVVLFMLLLDGDWLLGLRDGLEIVGIFTWSIFLVTGLILMPTLLVDIIYKKLPILIVKSLRRTAATQRDGGSN